MFQRLSTRNLAVCSRVGDFSFIKFEFEKKKNNFLHVFKSQSAFFKWNYFFLALTYFCAVGTIFILFLVKFTSAAFLIDLFN